MTGCDKWQATIILTDASVTLRTGEDFDPYSFILSATDADGSSIMEEVACDELETSTPGEYLITYELRGQMASLRVNVTE